MQTNSDRLIGDVCRQCGVRLTDDNRMLSHDHLPWAICIQCAEAIAMEVREAKKQWYDS
jgi:hypothetical protein